MKIVSRIPMLIGFFLITYLIHSTLFAKEVTTMNAHNNALENESLEKATFAGGCFWCMESPFEQIQGVKSVVSGYAGGHLDNPTYEDVSSGRSGHLEVVQITFDPEMVDYASLLKIFWQQIDPTDDGGSFVDRGEQYGSAVFYHTDAQKKKALESRDALNRSGIFTAPVATAIRSMETFYPAEDYHQDYYKENPLRYKFYRGGSGRDGFIKKTWTPSVLERFEAQLQQNDGGVGSADAVSDVPGAYVVPPDAEVKKRLSPLQYQVTRKEGTEPPFDNPYWDNKTPGIYVDIISGEPLFSSTDKFDSGTGWPSFIRPIQGIALVEKTDRHLVFSTRTEVRSPLADSHLGHVFDDGPAPTGLRYCINSAALRFIPREDLEKEGYGAFESLFE